MIDIRYTRDAGSLRRGTSEEATTLKQAKRKIRCARGRRKKFTPVTYGGRGGFRRAWEVTCGNTVVADAFERRR